MIMNKQIKNKMVFFTVRAAVLVAGSQYASFAKNRITCKLVENIGSSPGELLQ
jgi:hypothetical protein